MHDHGNHVHHGPGDYNRAFALGTLLNVIYIVVEAGYGFATGSLALLADAGHNLSDVLGLLLAWGAHYLSHLPPTGRHTYGWRSSSILAALFNALLLLVAVGGIVWEAVRRLTEPTLLQGGTMMIVAGIGVIINFLTALLFFRGRHTDLNLRGAFLHMAADAGVSLGVVLSGLLISIYQWTWVDPLMSLVIALVIFLGTWSLLRESINLVLHGVPAGIELREVHEYLAALPGVEEVHDLHIWAMSTTETALTAHLVRPHSEDHDAFVSQACQELHERFGIEHSTLQVEFQQNNGCRLAPHDVV